MTEFQKHIVAIVSAEYQEAANNLSAQQGWGPGVYSASLSATSDEPATHYALATYVRDNFFAVLQEQSAASPDVAAVLAQVHMSVIPAGSETPSQHFYRVIAERGLQSLRYDGP